MKILEKLATITGISANKPLTMLDHLADLAREMYPSEGPLALIVPREIFDEFVAAMEHIGLHFQEEAGDHPLLKVKYGNIRIFPTDYLPVPRRWGLGTLENGVWIAGKLENGIWAVPSKALFQVLTAWQKMRACSKRLLAWPEREKEKPC